LLFGFWIGLDDKDVLAVELLERFDDMADLRIAHTDHIEHRYLGLREHNHGHCDGSTGYTLFADDLDGDGDEDVANDLLLESGGGCILVGSTESYGSGMSDFYVVVTDPVGNLVDYTTFGGPDDEIAYDIKKTADAGYVITGSHNGHVWVLRTGPHGFIQSCETIQPVEVTATNYPLTTDGATLSIIAQGSGKTVNLTTYDGTLVKTTLCPVPLTEKTCENRR